MGAKCYRSKQEDAPVEVNAAAVNSGRFSVLTNDSQLASRYPMITEGQASDHYSWDEQRPIPGSHDTFIGNDRKNGTAVAVTVIEIETEFSAAQRDALYAMCKYKAQTCQKTGGVHCVQIARVFYWDSTLSLVCHLKEGLTLPEAVNQAGKAYDEATALFWLADVAEGMQDLHQNGFVQGRLDIEALRVHQVSDKISSIQIPYFNLFSLAAPTQPACQWAGATPPELLLGEEKQPTQACDVWNMGVMLHTLLVGEPPLNSDAESTKKIISKRRTEEGGRVNIADFGGWDRIQTATQDLVVDMLRLIPEERLTAEQVYNEIEHIMHRSPHLPGEGEHLDVHFST